MPFSVLRLPDGVNQCGDHSVMSSSFMGLTTLQGYTSRINSEWQPDRKFCDRASLRVLFPFSLSTRRPASLGSRGLLYSVKRLLSVPFLLWTRNVVVWRSYHPPKTSALAFTAHFESHGEPPETPSSTIPGSRKTVINFRSALEQGLDRRHTESAYCRIGFSIF